MKISIIIIFIQFEAPLLQLPDIQFVSGIFTSFTSEISQIVCSYLPWIVYPSQRGLLPSI